MKRYKLLKDTPTIKAGTIFEEVVSDFDELKELVRITPVGAKTSPQWTIDDIHNFDEWFEEVKEFEEWKPKEGERYKYLDTIGEVNVDYFAGGNSIDEFQLSINNCYPLDTPDELIIKEQKLIPQALHRLKMAAKKAWFDFNGSCGPDWSDDEQNKWSIQHSHNDHTLMTIPTAFIQDLGQVYFPTIESAQTYIDNNLGDLKLLFGVE